jgi:short-subunit dehydrogenase
MGVNYLRNQPARLAGKVAIVSGSSMGIGKAIAWELLQQGAKVVLNGRDAEKLEKTKKEFRNKGYEVDAVVADIRYPDRCNFLINEAINGHGQLDILINNAAMSSRGSIEHSADHNFTILSETNYTGAVHLSKYAIPFLRKTEGQIIFINSAGGFRGMPYNSAYSVSKVAQAALADALRIELDEYNIHVGIAYLGFTQNDPKKMILDADGSLVYLPKRTNLNLATQESVAKSVRQMIVNKNDRITLTGLGRFANFSIRYLPWFSNWLLWLNREKIKKQFTMIGGEKVQQTIAANGKYEKVFVELVTEEE